MKHLGLISILAVSVMSASCGILAQINEENLKEAQGYVAKALDEHELAIEVNRILPSRGPAITSQDGYYLKVRDGKVNAYLPFFGTSYSAPIGTDDVGIKFEDCPIVIDDSQSKPSKGKYVWFFEAKCRMEKVYVTVTFWDNGSADIMCRPMNRSHMGYSGNLIAFPEK